MAKIWTQPNNYLLGTLEETVPISAGAAALPLSDTQNVIVSIISGALPPGISIDGTMLVGAPAEVIRDTEYKFVLRAIRNDELQDRTFRLRVSGPDQPEWVTPGGLLPVGPVDTLFILDNEIIDFQLEVTDSDLLAGDELIYYIEPGNGVLPPGITLTKEGRLTGVVEPLLALDKIESRGGYDTVPFDSRPLDFVIPTRSGWDSFYYDTQTYDYNLSNPPPKKLNRYYPFEVTVADKVSTPVRRQFQIYVVGDDFIKDIEDGVINANQFLGGIEPGNLAEALGGVITADLTFIRKPVWITPSDLGFVRSDNYTTIYLDTLRTDTLAGVITYSLASENPDGSLSELPPGTSLDSISGEVIGYIPNQSAVTREYKFTVIATRIAFSDNVENPTSPRTFTVRVLGEIDSVITWETPNDLGSINSNLTSTLQLIANTTVPDAKLLYRIVEGQLPEGLRLSYRGEIIGKATLSACECSNTEDPGLFKFTVEASDQFRFSASLREFTIKVNNPDGSLYSNLYLQPLQSPEKRRAFRNFISNPTVFTPDFIYRTNDPNFGVQTNIRILAYAGIERAEASKFAAATAKNHKRKHYNVGEVKRAVAKTPGTDEVVYEIVYLEVIDPSDSKLGNTQQRFGIKNRNGITADSSSYDAKDVPLNQDLIADEPRRLRNHLNDTTIKADNSAVIINQTGDTLRYLSNISNMRKEIEKITVSTNVNEVITEVPAKIQREYLPLWMRTGQGQSIKELGFILAIPLVYCKPGTSKDMLLNIQTALKNNEFDFSILDLDVDRYILDSSLDNEDAQYILFANYHYNE